MAQHQDRTDGRAYPPFGMTRQEAARHLMVSPATFDRWVKEGVMPKPRRRGGIARWVRLEIEEAALRLPTEGEATDEDKWLDRIGL
ncbi:helix-turn-helix transcriptional regulator [Acuticoccus mangrovi]|uniref:Helix-turn-helix domain-containing protein n=1 Tax=Acuticoccus mangrovi TaxID=2796142 RepID=A0A934IG38_9HYPH|nr:hypothetical protein [Acuticoccus mangrovi]MBJ3774346.1 hypothetical protein [Acuticoccus mangrovi]